MMPTGERRPGSTIATPRRREFFHDVAELTRERLPAAPRAFRLATSHNRLHMGHASAGVGEFPTTRSALARRIRCRLASAS